MIIDEQKFTAYLVSKKYTDSYTRSIVKFAKDHLSDVSEDEILACTDYTLLVEKILRKRYFHKDGRCKCGRITLSRVADFLRMEAAA